MEGVPGTNRASEDVISSMPENVITNIMNRLRIRDAVRTSILARNWRLKWTLLTQFVFNDEIPQSLGPVDEKYDYYRIISRLLLLLTGPVTKFELCTPEDQVLDVGAFNYWVLFLSRKGIKKFICKNDNEIRCKLPSHIFSCLELTHLILHSCRFHLPPTFSGFPNLLSLQLRDVRFKSGTFEDIIIWSPLLQIIDIDFYPRFKFDLDDIPKLENLKKLVLQTDELYKKMVITTSSIFQLLGVFPKLQELFLDFRGCKLIVEDVATKWLPTAFPSLNTLTFHGIDIGCGRMLSCVFEMIWSSPNLQELRLLMTKMTGKDEFYDPSIERFSSATGNNVAGQLQLQNVLIMDFRGSRNEECLIKYLLACSPFLKRITIKSILSKDEKLRATVKLLKLHRASPIAEVDFY